MKTIRHHHWLTPILMLVLAAAIGLAGCGGGSNNSNNNSNNSSSISSTSTGSSSSDSIQEPSDPQLQSYEVSLTGEQEVPMVRTEQSATATITINETEFRVMAEMNLSDVAAVNAAHIHAGEVGKNGPVLIGFSDLDQDGVWEIAEAEISQAQHDGLLAGNWYVNVHTDSYPEGELRGQILTDTQSIHVFNLSGDQEVPPVQTDAYGEGYLLYDSSNGALTLNTWAWNLTPTAAHIHHAEAGLNGDIVAGWEVSVDDDGVWQVPESTLLGADEVMALHRAGLYVNIHTEANPDGEIRGQILPDDYVLLLFNLSPELEVPPVSSPASGAGYATLNTASGGLRLNVWVMTMEANAAHIHQGGFGENGDVAMGLEENMDHGGLWQLPVNTALTSDTQALLLSGGHYVNVHSDEFPDGEIRGQIAE